LDRTVKVSLLANVSNYVRGFNEADAATKKTRDSAAQAAAKLQAQRDVMEATGRGAIVFGGLIAAGIAVAVAKYAEFDAAMSNVIATGDDARENQEALRQAALDAGASTVFSATEAANAIEELAKAGVSANDILGGALAGSLDLAAAGQLGVARAAEITSTALNQFKLDGGDAAQVADVLAAGAGKAMGSVDDLAQGLKFVGPVAASMGVSLEETTGTLALFAQQGIIGEQAGTSLRGVLSSLTSPSVQARQEIERLGITLYDSQGNFLGLQNAAGQLSEAYSQMDGASRDASLGIIFGRETVTAATALYQAGASGVQEWTEAVDDSGYAAEVARTRLDNLKGDLEALSGAIDTALIQSGSTANDTLRAMVQILTELVNGYSELPEPIQATVMVVGGATAAITLAGGAALAAVPKVVALKNSFSDAGISMRSTALTAGAAGLALGGLITLVGSLATAQAEARAQTEAYADSLESGTNRVTEATRELAVEALAARPSILGLFEDRSGFDRATQLGIDLDLVTDAVAGNADALRELNGVLTEYEAKQFNSSKADQNAAEAAQALRSVVEGQIGSLERAVELNEQKADAESESADSSKTAAEAYLEAASGAEELNSTLDDLIETINEANGVGQDAISQNLAYQDALAKVDEVIAAGTATLDQSTQAGRDNLGMLNDLAARAISAAEAQLRLDGDTARYKETLEASRGALIERAQQLGYNADEAAALADQILRIPSATEWQAIVETVAAQQKLDRFIFANDGRRISLYVDQVSGRQVAGGNIDVARASGGPVYGPGTETSDSIRALLSHNEHVVTAREVAAIGGHGAMYALRRAMLSGALRGGPRGFAGGGAVNFVQPQYMSSPSITVPAPVVTGIQDGQAVSIVIQDGPTLRGYIQAEASVVTGQALRDQRVQGEMGSRR
jgi:TP901 family phage tail tape measure protein